MIYSLQIYRGVAAMLVLLYHLRGKMSQYFETEFYSEFWIFGGVGVQFFFVLSGYIIFMTHENQRGDASAMPKYLLKRINRIFPPYWIVTLALTPFWFFVPQFAHDHHGTSVGGYLLSFFLVPQEHGTYLAVGWTLMFEMLFYGFFCLFFVARSFSLIAAFWAVTIVIYYLSPGVGNWLVGFLLSPLNLLFLVGMFLARCNPISDVWSIALYCIGVLGFVILGFGNGAVATTLLPAQFWWGLLSAIFVATARGPLEGFFSRRKFMILLGSASYSIYLVHFPVLSVSSKILVATGVRELVPNWSIWLLLIVVATSAGLVFHMLVEKPLVRVGAKLLGLRGTPQGGGSKKGG